MMFGHRDLALEGNMPTQCELVIQDTDGKIMIASPLDGAKWTTERVGSAGKFQFKVIKDADLDFKEGSLVKFRWNNQDVFSGFVFTKNRDRDGIINVLCYDQIRYLKNKDIFQYTDLTAADIIRSVCAMYELKLGETDDMNGYMIQKIRSSNGTALDFICSVFDKVTINTGQLYVFYDNFGKIEWKKLEDMKVEMWLDGETAENFAYKSTIDREVYNKVKVYYDDKSSGKREVYIAENTEMKSKWGLLQLYQSVNPKTTTTPAEVANKLLEMKCKVRRTLTVRDAFGDVRVRAGSSLYVRLNLGDIAIGRDETENEEGEKQGAQGELMVVERVTHKFTDNHHSMDVTLRGGVITN